MREGAWIIIWGLYLLETAIVDWKERMIPRWLLIFAAILVGITCLFLHVPIRQRLIGGVIGLVFTAISIWGKETVGLADALIILLLGVALGGYTQIVILGASLALLMFAAMALFLMKKVGRKDNIPFLPFLFTGYLIVFVVQIFA